MGENGSTFTDAIPAEIRTEIYGYVLSNIPSIVSFSGPYPAILGTNTLIRDEAFEVLAKCTTFVHHDGETDRALLMQAYRSCPLFAHSDNNVHENGRLRRPTICGVDHFLQGVKYLGEQKTAKMRSLKIYIGHCPLHNPKYEQADRAMANHLAIIPQVRQTPLRERLLGRTIEAAHEPPKCNVAPYIKFMIENPQCNTQMLFYSSLNRPAIMLHRSMDFLREVRFANRIRLDVITGIWLTLTGRIKTLKLSRNGTQTLRLERGPQLLESLCNVLSLPYQYELKLHGAKGWIMEVQPLMAE
jgi:hypothetical protein